jgi:putative oxidoreductase
MGLGRVKKAMAQSPQHLSKQTSGSTTGGALSFAKPILPAVALISPPRVGLVENQKKHKHSRQMQPLSQCAAHVEGVNKMPLIDSVLTTWSPRVLSIFRIILGLLFLEHGTSKYLSLPVSQTTGVSLLSLSGINGVIELVGGVLIVLGLFTRPVAFILSGDMAVAYFIAHAPRGFFPLLNGGELAIIYCFAFLYLAAAGGGEWSIDNLRAGIKTSRPRSA